MVGRELLAIARALIAGDLAVNTAARGSAEAALDVRFRQSKDRADVEAIMLVGDEW